MVCSKKDTTKDARWFRESLIPYSAGNHSFQMPFLAPSQAIAEPNTILSGKEAQAQASEA